MMQKKVAANMCSTTGNGSAKNRALSDVICIPPSWTRRMAPANTGTMLSTNNPAGISQSDLVEKVILLVLYEWARGHRILCAPTNYTAEFSQLSQILVKKRDRL